MVEGQVFLKRGDGVWGVGLALFLLNFKITVEFLRQDFSEFYFTKFCEFGRLSSPITF